MAEFDTVTVPEGELHTEELGDEDSLENVLFDITAPGSAVSIDAFGDQWLIRNIGVKGQQAVQHDEVPMVVGCPEDGDALVENVYLGDGLNQTEIDDSHRGWGGIMCHSSDGGDGEHHRGSITFRHVYGEKFGATIVATDAAASGRFELVPSRFDHAGGSREEFGSGVIEECYGRSNRNASFVVQHDPDVVRDCVSEQFADEMPGGVINYHANCVKAVYGSRNSDNCLAENCDLFTDDSFHLAIFDQGQLESNGTRTGGQSKDTFGPVDGETLDDPDTSIPEGVPETAEEAASGGDNGGGGNGGDDGDIAIDPARVAAVGAGAGLAWWWANR